MSKAAFLRGGAGGSGEGVLPRPSAWCIN